MKRTNKRETPAPMTSKTRRALRLLGAADLEQVRGGLGVDPLPTLDPPMGMEPQHNETLARDPRNTMKRARRPVKRATGVEPQKGRGLRSLDATALEQVRGGGFGTDPLPVLETGEEQQHNETLARDPHSRRRSPRRKA